jgi:hypothetical protein
VSILKPEGSIVLGAATAALVYGVYQISVPTTAQVHATVPGDVNVEAGRKKAVWTSAVFVSAVALMTRDKTIFVLGGLMLIALDWNTRHANASHPETGKVVTDSGYVPAEQAVPVAEQGGYGDVDVYAGY